MGWRGRLEGARSDIPLSNIVDGRKYARIRMDPSTTNETMVCSVAARSSAWPSGGECGTGRRVVARTETKMAETPI